MVGGFVIFGPTTVLKINDQDITVLVTSIRNQCLDRVHFTHFGSKLEDFKIIAVKSTVHFRADFRPIAENIINAGSPGKFM